MSRVATIAPLAPVPAAASTALTASFLLSAGACVHGDLRFLLGVPVTFAGFVVAWQAAGQARHLESPSPVRLERIAGWLSALAAIGLAGKTGEGTAVWYETVARVYFLLAIVAIGVFAGGDATWRRRALWTLVAGAVLLQMLSPIGVHPLIDVWSWTRTCTRALLHGIHPYTVRAADLHRGAYDFGSTPTVYPYTPMVLLASAPAEALFGDYRVGMALFLPLTIWLFRATGRRLAVDAALLDAMTIGLVLFPRARGVAAFGFTEPLLVLALAIFVWLAVRRPGGYLEAIAVFLLPAIKQYAVAPVLLYAGLRPRARALFAGAAAAAATVLVFVIWDPGATMSGVLYLVRARIGFRVDSDSVTALVAAVTGFETPRWVGIAAQFVVAGIAFGRLRQAGLGGLLLGSALALTASFLLATQAFYYYYYFASALLLYSALVFAGRARQAEPAA